MDLADTSTELLLSSIHDGLYITDTDRTIIYWNRAAELITGYSAAEVLGQRCSDNILIHVDHEGCNLCVGACPLDSTLHDAVPRDVDIYLHHKSGYRIPVNVRTSAVTDDSGSIISGIELFTDISNREATRLRIQELERAAKLDHLTRLANRSYAELEMKRRMSDLQMQGIPFGLLFLDIDNFKALNDTCGHQVGDKALKVVAETMQSAARPFDIFCRWGGEEFLGILPNVEMDNLTAIGNTLRVLIENSYFMTPEGQRQVTVSIGATLGIAGEGFLETVHRADELMYRSKSEGRNRLSFG